MVLAPDLVDRIGGLVRCDAWPMRVSIARFTAGARVGRNLATRTVVPRPRSASMWKASISRRAPRRPTSETPSEARLEPNLASTARILLVDDDLVFGDAIAGVLLAAGFEVSLAPDHRLALEDLASTRTIDLLISDIVMPERVNGIALSRMARMPGARSIAVVFSLLGRSKFVDPPDEIR